MACEGGGGCDGSRSIGETGGWCATGLECAARRIFFNTNFANLTNFTNGSGASLCKPRSAREKHKAKVGCYTNDFFVILQKQKTKNKMQL